MNTESSTLVLSKTNKTVSPSESIPQTCESKNSVKSQETSEFPLPRESEAISTPPNTVISSQQTVGSTEQNLQILRNIFHEKSPKNDGSDGNQTYNGECPDIPVLQAPTISKEALMTDAGVRSTVKNLEEIQSALHRDAAKSTELANEWKSLVNKLDVFIKALKDIPWKKAIAWSSCIVTVGFFVMRIIQSKALPDFLENTGIQVAKQVLQKLPESEITNKTLENTLHNVLDAPLSLGTIFTAVGSAVTFSVVLRGLAFVLRNIPK